MIDVVVVYDRATASMLEEIIFVDDPQAAFEKRLERELTHRKNPQVEVVLLNARSREDLKISHARYFDPQAFSYDRMKERMDELARRLVS